MHFGRRLERASSMEVERRLQGYDTDRILTSNDDFPLARVSQQILQDRGLDKADPVELKKQCDLPLALLLKQMLDDHPDSETGEDTSGLRFWCDSVIEKDGE